MVTKVYRSVLLSHQHPDQLAAVLGYTLVSSQNIEVHKYIRSGYTIELSRVIRDNSAVRIPDVIYDYYLVKVFVEIEDGVDGEKILNSAYKELEGRIKLSKPSLACFN